MKFHENPLSNSGVLICSQTDGWTDATMLTGLAPSFQRLKGFIMATGNKEAS
jgi:hypothetical protein